jgi:hypothetical protein
MTTFKFLSYDEWLEQNPDAKQSEQKCTACNGSGIVVCFHCGNDSSCEDCEGEGVIQSAREEYERQLTIDRARVNKYAERAPTPTP